MYRKIRITVVALVLAIICIASSSGTLSYFTDTDDASNSFVVGRVASTLSIYKDTSGTIFTESDYDASNPLAAGMTIPYYLQAENTGNISAYQRFRIVIPIALKDIVSVKLGGDLSDCDVKTATNNTCEDSIYLAKYDSSVEVNNVSTYAVYYIESKNILEVGQATEDWPTSALYISEGAGSTDLSELTCGESVNNCTLGIKVYSDTIQTYGFDDVTDAFSDFSESY